MRKIKRALSRLGDKIAANIFVYEIVTSFMMLGALYLAIMGGLMVVLTTDCPLRSVVSDSMKHRDNMWMRWFRDYDVSKFPIRGGFERGDLLLIRGVNPESLKVGDVIVYEKGGTLIAHRILAVENRDGEIHFRTKGDGNPAPDIGSIPASSVRGKVVLVVPNLGWPSIWWREG